jgi:hypothetical protein
MTYAEYRSRYNLTQAQLASLTAISLGGIQKAEQRKGHIPKQSLYMFSMIARLIPEYDTTEKLVKHFDRVRRELSK